MIQPNVHSLFRYPVKGMTPERLETARLQVGATMPFDRAYAIENGSGRFDPEDPKYLPKINFLMLMRNERLASLEARFEDSSHTLTILRAGRQVAKGNLSTAIGRQLVEQFLAAYMRDDLRGAPKIVSAPGHSFSDVALNCLHIVNLASVQELTRAAGRAVDPLRFRANVYVAGLPPWVETDWVGKQLRLGSVEVGVVEPTVRCEATNVDPESGSRDMGIPALLQRTWGRSDFGIYAKVTGAGDISTGDAIIVP
jgi:uncharacterized protein YcbX